jgi:hypothetical protein
MALQKKFLFGVGNVVAMQDNDIVFTGKTLLDSGIEISTSNTEVRGGQGNALQAIYYHTSALSVTITDTQWSLPLIALNTGSDIVAGGDVWSRRTVTITAGAGDLNTDPNYPATLTNSDIAVAGDGAQSVWVEYDGTNYTLPVTSGTATFSATSSSGTIPNGTVVCVTFLETKNSAQSIIIPSNLVPERVRLYITANLSGDTTGKSGFIGTATIEIPICQLSGAQTIAMSADGVANTPLSGNAIAYSDSTGGCTDGSYYARITEDIFTSNWYDGVSGLAIEGGDFAINGLAETSTLRVWAVKGGNSFIAPNSDLDFVSATVGTATIGAHTGIVTTVGTGTTLLTVNITAVPTIEASCTLTVTND